MWRSSVVVAALGMAAAVVVPGASPGSAVPGASTEIVVSPKGLGTIARGDFGANLLWPYSAGGSFDGKTDRWYPSFVAEVKRLGITSLRYPGGTTADSFFWQRAIGPEALRRNNEPYGAQSASLRNHALVDGPIPSTVGPDEFGQLLDATGASGTVVVNFATGSVQDAAGLVAYLAAPVAARPSSDPSRPSYWAAMRARNGHRAPYDVSYVEIGNEQLVPAEYGWRSGALVHLGPHSARCPKAGVAVCLYAFGGTTRFTGQTVGRFADDRPAASRSNGARGQRFTVYYPPVVPGSLTVRVGGRPWQATSRLASAGPGAHVYHLDAATGQVSFGDGRHGAIPAKGALVTADYSSGPHGGFVDFYRAIKAMDPRVQVCETEAPSLAFLEVMGTAHPYDCAELHFYALPKLTSAPLAAYQAELMGFPQAEAASLAGFQRAARRISGRPVPVVLTEYGQLVAPMPKAYPHFILSLDESLLIAAQLRQWIDHGVPIAEKYLLTSAPFLANDPRRVSIDSVLQVSKLESKPEWDPGLSIDSAMIAGPGPKTVTEPTGQVVGLMSALGGHERLASSVRNGPSLPGAPSEPALLTLAATVSGHVDLVVINSSLTASIRARVVLQGFRHANHVRISVLDGPSPTAFNTPSNPTTVRVTARTVAVGSGPIAMSFPAHSVTLLRSP